MSLLSRKHTLAAATGLAATLVGTTAGAEIWTQPVVTLSSSYNTNIDLDAGPSRSAVGYFADIADNIDIATRTSDNVLQPRLLYNYYPSASYRNRLEGFLNSYTAYRWQRDRFTMIGYFDHRDDKNAEQPSAEVNPVNPGVGENTPTTGTTTADTTRNYVILDPTYSHLLTPLSSVGFSGEYQGIRYSPAQNGNDDFNYFSGRLFYARTLDLRTDYSIGISGSKYQSTTIDSHATTGGISGGVGFNWNQTIRSDLTAEWQHANFDESDPKLLHANANPWSANFSTVYKEQISSYRFTLGRTIYPSSNGTLYTIDQVRGQYDRDLTQRVHFTTALRFFRDDTTLGGTGNDKRNYLTGTIRAQWMVTQRLFLAGSYTYIYQKYQVQPNSAEVNVASISIGYRGLDKPQ